VFDGTHIWVTNNGSNTVTELLASTGATVATYTVGSNPVGIAFDGANIWVANSGSGSVTRIAPPAQ
jgi:YVTN family beta-propeller protein